MSELGRRNNYRTIVVGTDGSSLADLTVGRAAWLAVREDAQLVIVCVYSPLSRRTEAKNTNTMGGDVRTGTVLGRAAAEAAGKAAVAVAEREGAKVAAALIVEGDPAGSLLSIVDERDGDLLVIGAIHDRSLAEKLLGTVAGQITKRAACDVLIVRPIAGVESGEQLVPEDV